MWKITEEKLSYKQLTNVNLRVGEIYQKSDEEMVVVLKIQQHEQKRLTKSGGVVEYIYTLRSCPHAQPANVKPVLTEC